MTAYSDTPLQKKLGIRENMSLMLINPPGNYHRLIGKLPEQVTLRKRAAVNTSFMHGFVTSHTALRRVFNRALRYLARDGMLWVSWPKKVSGVGTEVSESDVRKAGLAAGLVDIKICAVDETWSGLKFVYRLKDR